MKTLDALQIYLRRMNATEVLIRQRQDEFTFPIADGAAIFLGKDNKFRKPILRQEQPVRNDDLSGEIQGESGESQICQPTDDAGARVDFRSMQGSFIHLRHNELRVQLYAPKEETFTFPLKYIDVTRSTHTDLDVLPEKKIDDYWNVDSNKHMSEYWRGFTKLTSLN